MAIEGFPRQEYDFMGRYPDKWGSGKVQPPNVFPGKNKIKISTQDLKRTQISPTKKEIYIQKVRSNGFVRARGGKADTRI